MCRLRDYRSPETPEQQNLACACRYGGDVDISGCTSQAAGMCQNSGCPQGYLCAMDVQNNDACRCFKN
jgi:hypothetical protein